MKTMRAAMLALLCGLASMLALCGQGCAGAQAREHLLLPAMRQAWSGDYGLRFMAEREADRHEDAAAARADVAKADAAIVAGLPALISAAPWPHVDDLIVADIVRRIAAGEISVGVGESARENLLQFQRGRAALVQEVSR